MGIRQTLLTLLAGAAALSLAPSARAGDLYLTGNLAISTGTGNSGGKTPFFTNTGSDSDAAPAYGGALGLGFKLNEAFPKSWDVPLPAWGVRFEIEGMTGREYELRTNIDPPSISGAGYFTEVTAWNVMPNLWIDIPLGPPIAWAFGRIPVLEPLSLYTGAGLGLSTVDVDVTDNVSRGHREQFMFGWQAGIGLEYELTQRVTLAAGYQYVDLGHPKVTLKQAGSTDPFGNYTLDLAAHEFNFGVRVNFWEIPYPEKWALRRDVR
jgi:opacity protein-like surface antigen